MQADLENARAEAAFERGQAAQSGTESAWNYGTAIGLAQTADAIRQTAEAAQTQAADGQQIIANMGPTLTVVQDALNVAAVAGVTATFVQDEVINMCSAMQQTANLLTEVQNLLTDLANNFPPLEEAPGDRDLTENLPRWVSVVNSLLEERIHICYTQLGE